MSDRYNVVDLGEYRFSHINTKSFLPKPKECQHKQLTLDSNGDVVTCDSCGKQVGTFWALGKMAAHWHEWWQRLQRRGEEASAIEGRQVVLRAALVVEKAWRKKNMAPCCPHCSMAILPEDGFGERASVNKEMEMARRKRAKLGSKP